MHGVGQSAVRVVGQMLQSKRRFDRSVLVLPQTRSGVEPVVGQQTVAELGCEMHSGDEVVKDRLGDEVVEVDPGPARLDTFAALTDLALEFVRPVHVDAEQPVTVGTCAGAAAARLDTEKVVQDRNDEVVVKVSTVGPTDNETGDG